MRALVYVSLLITGCHVDSVSFTGLGPIADAAPGDGAPDAPDAPPGCAWNFTPTNIPNPCMLPPPVALHIQAATTIHDGVIELPKQVLTQVDGTLLTVIHLSSLTIDAPLTTTGGLVAFAVDGPVSINSTVVVQGGVDNPTQCSVVKATAGGNSTDANSGAGGGGGYGAAAQGGGGASGMGPQPGSAGSGGPYGVNPNLSPLRGGCSGAAGGRYNSQGVAADGGDGGGAIEIASASTITVTGNGKIDAAGRGGAGGAAHAGGGGGGTGGSILLDAAAIQLLAGAVICADGGSGGGGGGAVAGNNGSVSPCNGDVPAQTQPVTGSSGGTGGVGGYRKWAPGLNADSPSAAGGAGGGGGGAGGFIRVKADSLSWDPKAIVTPNP